MGQESKATPGPWVVVGRLGIHSKPGPSNEHFQPGTFPDWHVANATTEANAALIAASPVLLRELRYLVDCIESGQEPGLGGAHEAIKAATGGAS